MNVRLGDAAGPDNLTMSVPAAVTVAFPCFVPFSVILPRSREIATVVVFVAGTWMIRALGLADLAPPANDHRRE
jgi:hypothetical protein